MFRHFGATPEICAFSAEFWYRREFGGVRRGMTVSGSTPSARAVAILLAERAPELCGALLPAGRRVHGHWHVGSVSGESGKSLEVELVGDKAGLWLDRATGDGGDALNLVQAALGLRTPEALAWARRWLGIPDESGPRQRSRETAQRWSPRAEKLWREIRPLSGSIGARYLSDRGCVPPESDEVRFSQISFTGLPGLLGRRWYLASPTP